MDWLETKIPPPVVLVLAAAAAYGITRLLPALSFPLPLRTAIAIAFAIAGVMLNLIPKLAFGRARTTINPLKPSATTTLVTTGIYRHSRNPMYLGQCLILLGWVLYLHNAAALLVLPAYVLYVTRFQILPEERHLSTRFPEAFDALCRQARRWL